MLTTLAAAPVGMPLVIERIVGPEFAARLQRLGLYEGVSLTRLDDSVAVGPAKIRGPHGEVTLGGGTGRHPPGQRPPPASAGVQPWRQRPCGGHYRSPWS